MINRENPLYVEANNPKAKFIAYGGESRRGTKMDMGGWTGSDPEEFLQAIQDEAVCGGGAPLPYVEIRDHGGRIVLVATRKKG